MLGLGCGFTSPAVLGGGGAAAAVVGGAALLEGETDGFAVDFTYAVDAKRVAVKVAGVVTEYAVDAFFSNGSTSPKQVFDVSGALVWAPHNMYIQSATPATRSVTTITGATYTVTVTGSGSLTGSSGAAGVATQASPLTYVATGTTSTFTLAGSLTQVQMNRGSVATAYIATTAAARYGLALDYDPVTHAAKGALNEPAATNLLLNNETLSTQSVTVTAVAHTLSFWGTGTVTLSGVSTAGPLVGTGVNDRVSLTFTPTAGSLTCTVSGTVSRAQLETGSIATSSIPTYAATVTRPKDAYNVTPASINYSATAGSWWAEIDLKVTIAAGRVIGYSSSNTPIQQFSATVFALNDGASLNKTVSSTLGSTKVACAFQSADRAITAAGLAPATSVTAGIALGTPGALIGFGYDPSGGGSTNGYIRKGTYRPRRISNAELQTETA